MTPEQLRAVLLERLPADPKWRAWVEGVVERVGTVEDPRIARITALCDEIDNDLSLKGSRDEGLIATEDVRAVLGEVQPTPPHGIDRDALRKVIWELVEAVDSAGWTNATVARAETAILALVWPVEGVVLTPEEAAFVLRSVHYAIEEVGPRADLEALAARLEASS